MSDLIDHAKTSPSELWDKEYDAAGIPSSTRSKPSNVVLDFIEAVTLEGKGGYALDIGCGTGRNSFYLAERGFEVVGMDYSRSQIDTLKASQALSPVKAFTPLQQDVSQPWLLPDGQFDLAVDCFCFKHQIGGDAVKTYTQELARTLKRGAMFLLFFATRQDGYYRQFPIDDQYGTGQIILDPGNGIYSRLYDIDEIVDLFPGFEVVHQAIKPGCNEMHGKMFDRESAIVYLRRIALT